MHLQNVPPAGLSMDKSLLMLVRTEFQTQSHIHIIHTDSNVNSRYCVLTFSHVYKLKIKRWYSTFTCRINI